MVSLRCKMVVKESISRLGLQLSNIELGLIELFEDATNEQRNELKKTLLKSGMVLLDGEETLVMTRTKNLIAEMIHYADEVILVDYPAYISQKLGYEYAYLSKIFAEIRGCDIMQYIISQKVERVKELILYDELNLHEIAKKLNYKNVEQLSKQFKSITGLTPTYFKALKRIKKQITVHHI